MAVIGYLIFGMIILAVVGYLFYLLRTVIVVGTFLLAAYLIFFTNYLMSGILVGIGWLVLASVFEKCEEYGNKKDIVPAKSKKETGGFFSSTCSKSRHGKRKATSKKGINYSYLLLWMIPLFWPFLIFQTFFRDKPAGVLNEYDYEQHLKCNRK